MSEAITSTNQDLIRAKFDEDGYVVLPAVFNGNEIAVMQQEADFILDLIINSSLFHERQSRRLDIRRNKAGMVVRKIQPIIDLSLPLSRVSRDERLIGVMRTLMNDEPVLMEEKLNYKQPVPVMDFFQVPEDDDRFPIHNDYAYYLYNGYPDSIVSSAITMDDCHAGNGTILMFPGTHRSHIEHVRVRNGLEVPEGTVEMADAVPLDVPAGSVVLFHSMLLHTSLPNDSGAPRRMMIYSHYPKAANMGIDIRNGPTRLVESPWEWGYLRDRPSDWQPPFKVDATGQKTA
ncbi:MAG: phytanoyl-CoA dioxygenase family protein [Pseudomonadota bacterium]